ncbi:hypothetical protein TNCV_693991 [Trichonephila clavipes]|nr:hypothetical protein TNCV_693991 [Trichonephila clavipes]
MNETLTTARDMELEVNVDDIEELIMGHEDELTIEELQELFFSCSESVLIRGLSITFILLIGTQTVPGSPQFRFRLPSRSPYHFTPSLKGPRKDSLLNPVFSFWVLSLPLYPLSHTIHLQIILLCSLVPMPSMSVSAPLIFCCSCRSQPISSLAQ